MSTSPPPPPSPPLPAAPVLAGTIEFFLSGGLNNPFPGSSIGGPISKIVLGQIPSGLPSNLYSVVTPAQALSGVPHQYRCFFVQNTSIGTALRNTNVWFETLNSDQDVTYLMGLGSGGINSTPATIATEFTAPAGVVFSQPTSLLNSLPIGTLRANDFIPIWIDRQVAANAVAFYEDSFVVRVEGASQPAPVNVPDFGVAAAGNFSCSSETAALNIGQITDRQTSVPPLQRFLALGDLAVSTSSTCWFTMTKNIDSITHVVLGNEEMTTEVPLSLQPALLNSYLNHYHLSVPYYSFNYGPVHFLVMNTEILYVNPSPQYNFVANDLALSQNNANVFWNVVCLHQPIYSAGGAGPDGAYVPASFRDLYHPLFDTYAVDLVLSAHPYNYQRTLPIIWNGVTPTVAAAGPNFVNPGAPIMLNIGTGGQPLDSATPFTTPIPAFYAFTNNTDFGYLWLTFTNQATVCTGTFYNVGDIALDTFSITKS